MQLTSTRWLYNGANHHADGSKEKQQLQDPNYIINRPNTWCSSECPWSTKVGGSATASMNDNGPRISCYFWILLQARWCRKISWNSCELVGLICSNWHYSRTTNAGAGMEIVCLFIRDLFAKLVVLEESKESSWELNLHCWLTLECVQHVLKN